MATLGLDTASSQGVTLTAAAVAGGGDSFANDGKTRLFIVNSSGANAYTVTVASAGQIDGLDIEDPAVSVGTSAQVSIGPFPMSQFNDSSGNIALTYTGSAPATDLTISVLKG